MIKLEDFGKQLQTARESYLDVGSRALKKLAQAGYDHEANLREFAAKSEFDGLTVEVVDDPQFAIGDRQYDRFLCGSVLHYTSVLGVEKWFALGVSARPGHYSLMTGTRTDAYVRTDFSWGKPTIAGFYSELATAVGELQASVLNHENPDGIHPGTVAAANGQTTEEEIKQAGAFYWLKALFGSKAKP